MLATKSLPENYRHWNLVHGAPHGYTRHRWSLFRSLIPDSLWERMRGPFAFQGNNSIRAFEYPWAFHAAGLEPGMKVLEIGGGLSGFQFVLGSMDCRVVNVDPGMEKLDWPCNPEFMEILNKRFGTDVQLRNTTISNAALEDDAYDRIFSISVIEHLDEREIQNIMNHAYRCLKPGGLFLMTIDLFLNLAPFTGRLENEYGGNRNVRWIAELMPFEVVEGELSELFGYDGFDPERILSNLDKYLIGQYPALSQCLVLRKPEA